MRVAAMVMRHDLPSLSSLRVVRGTLALGSTPGDGAVFEIVGPTLRDLTGLEGCASGACSS